MKPVAIGRLHHDEISFMEVIRIPDHRLIEVPYITGKDYRALTSFRKKAVDTHRRGSKQMAGVLHLEPERWGKIDALPIPNGAEKCKGSFRIGRFIQRFDSLLTMAEAFPALPFSLALLYMRGVLKHDTGELHCR